MIEFYIGILKEDELKLLEIISKEELEVLGSYDDIHGYFTYCLKGKWESYRKLSENSITKSIEHFEE